MKTNKQNYQYLLRLYSFVDEYLADIPAKQENLPDVIVSFCIVTEKLFKIKLHKKNPVLVYENSKIKENDALVFVIKKKESNDMITVGIQKTIDRYKLMFDGEFSDDEMKILEDIYKVRNHFIHGYKSDEDILSDSENIVKKMGTVWEKISAQAVSVFSRKFIKANKPKKKYSEEELEKVLIEEVKKKIESQRNYLDDVFKAQSIHSAYDSLNINGEKCPRCGTYEFFIDTSNSDIFSATSVNMYNPIRASSDLYKCKKCNLELTRKEYEIAKKIKPDNPLLCDKYKL